MVEPVGPLSRSRHQIFAALSDLEGSLIDGRFRLEFEAATGMSYQLEVDIVTQVRLQCHSAPSRADSRQCRFKIP